MSWWPWRRTPLVSTDPAHVRASEQTINRLDHIADRLEKAENELREVIEAERQRAEAEQEGGGG